MLRILSNLVRSFFSTACNAVLILIFVVTMTLALATAIVHGQSTVVYVDINNGVDGPPNFGQIGWDENAHRLLQDALDAAKAIIDQQIAAEVDIWVAQGTYRPDQDANNPNGTGNRDASFHMQNNVRILGGFPPDPHTWNNGQGAMIDDRDPKAFVTILSGDLDEDDDWDIYDGNDELLLDFFNYGENSYAVVRAEGAPFNYGEGDLCDGNCGNPVDDGEGGTCSCALPFCIVFANCCPGVCVHCASEECEDEGPFINNSAVLDGFTIRGAHPDEQNPGAAIYGINAAPQILNCVIERNWSKGVQQGRIACSFPDRMLQQYLLLAWRRRDFESKTA
jgi:hypothetical protein